MNKLKEKIPPHIYNRGISTGMSLLLIALAVIITWSIHGSLFDILGHKPRWYEIFPLMADLDWATYLGIILAIATTIYKIRKMFGRRRD